MNDNLPSNSDKTRNYSKVKELNEKERPTPKAVASGVMKPRKKGIFGKVKGFIFDDELDAPTFNINEDIIKPQIKNTFLDILSAISGGILDSFESALFKDSYARGKRSRRGRGRDREEYRNGYIDYSAPSRGRGSEDRDRRELSRAAREMQDFSDITYYNGRDENGREITARQAADKVLGDLRELVDIYGNARVSDFLVLSRFSPSYQDKKWGWYDLSKAHKERTSDGGYYLVLPKPVLLKEER